MQISKEFLLGGSLALATLLSIWLTLSVHREHDVLFDKNAHYPDAIAEVVTSTRMDANGHIQDRLTSPKIFHYPDNKTTDLITPHLMMYHQSAKPWHIDARYGRTYDGTKQIDVWKNVKAHREQDGHNKETTLLTSAMTLFPQHKYALTQQAITAIQPDLTIYSIGARIDLKKGETYLISKVHGHYEPSR